MHTVYMYVQYMYMNTYVYTGMLYTCTCYVPFEYMYEYNGYDMFICKYTYIHVHVHMYTCAHVYFGETCLLDIHPVNQPETKDVHRMYKTSIVCLLYRNSTNEKLKSSTVQQIHALRDSITSKMYCMSCTSDECLLA